MDGGLECAVINLDSLHHYWPYIRQGLVKLIERWGEEWIPEDIYAALRSGDAELVMYRRSNEQLVGFAIAQPTLLMLTRVRQYYVIVIWAEDKKYSFAERRMVLEFMKHRAKENNCTELIFGTKRHGWERFGAELLHYVYRWKV